MSMDYVFHDYHTTLLFNDDSVLEERAFALKAIEENFTRYKYTSCTILCCTLPFTFNGRNGAEHGLRYHFSLIITCIYLPRTHQTINLLILFIINKETICSLSYSLPASRNVTKLLRG